MTFPPDEYGELLRRAMRAEADLVVPSPEGLNIIRDRIEQRGLRGIFWWRVSASLAGAVLVAGTVVMLIPELRTQVVESTGTSQTTGDSTQPPDTSSIQRPPATNQPLVIASPGPPQARPTPVATPKTTPVATPTPTRPKPCVSSAPTPELIEPEPSASESCPVTETPTPNPTPSASPSPTPTPSDCSGDECASPGASETPTETISPDSEESPGE
jgi:hypothetical protein